MCLGREMEVFYLPTYFDKVTFETKLSHGFMAP
jgi:hypothetical protein